tara:strand:- start:172 stop:693 length:522 start_codon:yes stop_codon:yes gene_type:complete
MKNVLYFLVLVLSFSCSTNNVTMTFDDEKSNAIRSHYQNYLKNDVPALQSLWSPDLKIYMNSVEASTVTDISDLITVQHEVFENISMSFNYDEGSDDLGVWVQTINYPAMNGNPAATITQTWFNWSATGKSSGNTISIPVHISFEWADGKIVREWHNFDTTAMMAEIELASQG